MYRLSSTTILIFSLSFIGCSPTYQKKPSDSVISSQEKNLRSVYIGQAENDVLALLSYATFDSFDVMEDGRLFSYKELRNYDTNVEFGLYFENGKLESVIMDDEVRDLFSCRTMFKTNGKHWLSNGIKPYVKWIKSKDHLTKGINYRISHSVETVKHKAFNEAVGSTMDVIVYSPLIVAGVPIIIYDQLSGKTEKEQANIQNRYELYDSIEIGEPVDSVLASVGKPNRTNYVNGAKVLTYTGLSYSYGIKNNIVVWKEHHSMFELYSRQLEYGDAFYGETNCGSLEEYWKALHPTQ